MKKDFSNILRIVCKGHYKGHNNHTRDNYATDTNWGGYKVRTKDEWFYRLPTWIRLGIISLVWLLLLFIQFLVFGIKFGNSILSKPMADYRIFCIEIILSAYWLFFIIWQLNVLMKYLDQKQISFNNEL